MFGRTMTMLLAGSAAMLPFAAHAQDAAPGDTAAAAPEAAPQISDDIVVTAQKRAENVQDVPINIMAFGNEALTQAGVFSPSDLQRIAPSFKSTSVIGTLATRFSIRGIGTFGNSAIEPSVASFIDGIYVPRPASIVNSQLDIQSVEVLSGPQGTLFGRNASVGALSFHTGTPSSVFSANIRTDYSTGAHSRTEGYVNVPLGEKVAVRVAGLADIFGGYWKDSLNGGRFGGLDTYQGRVSLKADLAPGLSWTVRADYQKNDGDAELNGKLVSATLTPTTLARLTAVQNGIVPDLDQYGRRNNSFHDGYDVDDSTLGLSSDLSYTTSGDFTFRLLDGYYDWDSNQSDGDTAIFSAYILGRNLFYHSKSNSHEFQIVSPKDKLLDGKLDFVGGLYYFHEDLGIRADGLNGTSFCTSLLPLASLAGVFASIPGATTAAKIATCQGYGTLSSRGDFDQSTRSVAAYGQATFKIVPTVELTGGIRYTDEKKTADYLGTIFNPTGGLVATNETTALRLKENKFTYRANLAWRPTDDTMLFGTYSTGFKSGGFNNGIATRNLGQARIFNAETVKNYELGFKSQFMDRAITLNATAFRMNIGNFQERSITNTTSTIRNVGSVRQQGVELDSVFRPVAHLRLNAAATYLDSKITNYRNAPLPPYCPANLAVATAACPVAVGGVQDLAGARLTYTPKWSGVAGATIDGAFGGSGWSWLVNGDVNFTTRQKQGTTIDNGPLLVEKGYALFNARLTVYGPSDKYSIGVYARNLTGKNYCSSRIFQVLEGPVGLRYDSNGDGVNDGTATRCFVGAPRVIGATASAKF